MLVKGFIDTVGYLLGGQYQTSSHTYGITVFGGGSLSNIQKMQFANTAYYSCDESRITNLVNTNSGSIDLDYKGILLGTSDIAPTSSDADIADSEYCQTGTITYTKNKIVVTGTYTNSTSDTKTFKEIGLIGWKGYTSGYNYVGALYSRSVFSEPVVIPAGESKSFTITIDFNKFADTVVTA